MTPARSQQLVVGCLATSAIIAAGSTLAQGHHPTARQLLGGGVVAVGLSTAALFQPELAGTFATLILVSSVFYYGGPFLSAVTARTATPSPTMGTTAADAARAAGAAGGVTA